MSIVSEIANAVAIPILIEVIVVGSSEALYYGKFISESIRNNIIFISFASRLIFLSAIGVFIFAANYFHISQSNTGRLMVIIVLVFATLFRYFIRRKL